MRYASAADLVTLLLQQSDRHPVRVIDAVDLEPFDPVIARRLCSLGVLKERVDLREDGQSVLQVVGSDVISFHFETGASRRLGEAGSLRQYDIDFGVICREMHAQSGLSGPRPKELSERVWRLGRHDRDGRTLEVCIARHLREATAQQVVDHVRGAYDPDALVVLVIISGRVMPTPVARQIDGLRIVVATTDDLMGDNPDALFALNFSSLRLPLSTTSARDTRLQIDRIGSRTIFDGFELAIEPRDFGVLVTLCDEAADAGGWVSGDRILTALQNRTGVDGNPEQASKSINRLRDAFRKDSRLAGVPSNGFIETKPKTGYRFVLESADIGFIAGQTHECGESVCLG